MSGCLHKSSLAGAAVTDAPFLSAATSSCLTVTCLSIEERVDPMFEAGAVHCTLDSTSLISRMVSNIGFEMSTFTSSGGGEGAAAGAELVFADSGPLESSI